MVSRAFFFEFHERKFGNTIHRLSNTDHVNKQIMPYNAAAAERSSKYFLFN